MLTKTGIFGIFDFSGDFGYRCYFWRLGLMLWEALLESGALENGALGKRRIGTAKAVPHFRSRLPLLAPGLYNIVHPHPHGCDCLATLAQLVEQQTENLRVWSSILRGGNKVHVIKI